MGPVKVHVLALAAHPDAGRRYLDIMLKTLAEFDRRFGPYPYKIITVIDQAVYGTQVLDYAVDSVSSSPVQWWVPEPDDKNARKMVPYMNTVYLRHRQDFVLPVTVEVIFDDGTRVRDHWDGVDRWKKLTYVRNAKVVSAEIDPDHSVLLDVDFFNNSFTTKANGIPARKFTTIWVAAQQFFAQIAAWVV